MWLKFPALVLISLVPITLATLHPIFGNGHTLSQNNHPHKLKKTDDNPAILGLNNIDKHATIKNGQILPINHTHLPGALPGPNKTPPTTPSESRYHILHFQNANIRPTNATERPIHTDHDPDSAQSNAKMEAKLRRVIEMTLISCAVTIVAVLFLLAVRISNLLYKRFRNSENLQNPEPSIHYTPAESGPGPGPIPPIPMYTVMPGHFILQQCFSPNSTPRANSDPGNASDAVPDRPETPPPPYPGEETIKD